MSFFFKKGYVFLHNLGRCQHTIDYSTTIKALLCYTGGMRTLFLTSVAANVLSKIASSLPNPPKEFSVAFIPTAADPYETSGWVKQDRDKLMELGFKVFDFDLKNKNGYEVMRILTTANIIFVAGGNTFYLLEQVKKSGFDKAVKILIGQGIIYIGSSAGSVIAGPSIEPMKCYDDPLAETMDSLDALNLVDFVVLPHANQEKYKTSLEKATNDYKEKYKLIPLMDTQFVVVRDTFFQLS